MLYNDRLDPKTATAEQIVCSFYLEYYDKEIEKTKERIFNVRTGKPEFSGIYSYNSGKVYSGKALAYGSKNDRIRRTSRIRFRKMRIRRLHGFLQKLHLVFRSRSVK